MSLRIRFALASSAVVVVTVLGLGILVDQRLRAELQTQADHTIDVGPAAAVMTAMAAGPDQTTTSVVADARKAAGPLSSTLAMLIRTSDGRVTTLTGGAPATSIDDATWNAAVASGPQHVSGTVANGVTGRFAVFPVSGPGTTLVTPSMHPVFVAAVAVGGDAGVANAVHDYVSAYVLGGGIALVLAIVVALLVAHTAVRPVTELTEAVEAISTSGDLSVRVPEVRGRHETAHLSRVFNHALAHVETMYQALEAIIVKQRRFVSDASHELRTPLTTMSGSLEAMTLFPDMEESQRQRIVTDALAEARRMARLVDDLLALASLDTGERLQLTGFDWTEFLEPLAAAAGANCAPRQVTVDIADDLGAGVGDVRSLQRLVEIVVANVVAHTPETCAVTFRAARRDDDVILVVSDNGPGVPPDLGDTIFERFVQADAARQGESSGLGLAIGRAVAVAHGGTLMATAAVPHGLVVTARIPLVATATPDRRRRPRPGKAGASVQKSDDDDGRAAGGPERRREGDVPRGNPGNEVPGAGVGSGQ